jgi:hypothetical protein
LKLELQSKGAPDDFFQVFADRLKNDNPDTSKDSPLWISDDNRWVIILGALDASIDRFKVKPAFEFTLSSIVQVYSLYAEELADKSNVVSDAYLELVNVNTDKLNSGFRIRKFYFVNNWLLAGQAEHTGQYRLVRNLKNRMIFSIEQFSQKLMFYKNLLSLVNMKPATLNTQLLGEYKIKELGFSQFWDIGEFQISVDTDNSVTVKKALGVHHRLFEELHKIAFLWWLPSQLSDENGRDDSYAASLALLLETLGHTGAKSGFAAGVFIEWLLKDNAVQFNDNGQLVIADFERIAGSAARFLKLIGGIRLTGGKSRAAEFIRSFAGGLKKGRVTWDLNTLDERIVKLSLSVNAEYEKYLKVKEHTVVMHSLKKD